MAQITSAEVLLIAPELSGMSVDQWADVIADVYTEIVVENWPSEAKANRAAKYLAAHLATMNTRRAGAGGPVQSRTVGSVSTTYAAVAGAIDLTATSYGQEFKRLLRLSFGGPLVV